MDDMDLEKINKDTLEKVTKLLESRYNNLIIRTMIQSLYSNLINTHYKLNMATIEYKKNKENLSFLQGKYDMYYLNYPGNSNKDHGIELLKPNNEIINALIKLILSSVYVKTLKASIKTIENMIKVYVEKLSKGKLTINQL